jgi:indolepyruvate ferredoxin oxidoreductase, beta subunit
MSQLKRINAVIMALGDEGAGKFTAWLAKAAERSGYIVQTTSESGSAGRSGSAMYYLELFPRALAAARGKPPVLGLTPLPGHADIVIASELMEAGRAVTLGLVTPDRTALVASTHRVYTMAEKTAPSDARANPDALLAACRSAAASFTGFDLAGVAARSKCPANAVLLGAVAASGSFPIPAAIFEEVLRESCANPEHELAGFAAGLAAKDQAPAAPLALAARKPPRLPGMLVEEARRYNCGDALAFILAGLERTSDYQDDAYAALYWERLLPFVTLASNRGSDERELLGIAARQIALAMAYSDVIRVAELKIRASRFARVRESFGVEDGDILEIAEFMHPRVEEIADTMPTGLGKRLFNSAIGRAIARQFTQEGHLVHTTSIRGFLMLYFVASLKPWRRVSLRYARETERLEEWLELVWAAAKRDLKLAVSLARARGLLRGYGATLDRGYKKFETISDFVRNARFNVPASSVNTLIAAAQSEEGMDALETALAKLKAEPQPVVGYFSPAK